MNKKAEVMQQLGALGVGIASLAIVLTVGFLVIVQARAQGAAMEGQVGGWDGVGSNCTQSATCNATTILRTSLGTVPGWIPLVVIAVIGAALLGLVGLFMKTRQ